MKANQIWMYKIFKDSLLLIGQYFNETPSRHLSYFPWGRMARRAQLDSLKMWHLRANFLTKLLQNDCHKMFQNHVFQPTEAVLQRCSAKKVFLVISQNSQENTCVTVSFLINLQNWGQRPTILSKKETKTQMLWQNF